MDTLESVANFLKRNKGKGSRFKEALPFFAWLEKSRFGWLFLSSAHSSEGSGSQFVMAGLEQQVSAK